MKKIALLLTMASLTACGTIDNSIRSDESLKIKAAYALGTTADQIKISNRHAELEAVHFNATRNGHVFQCYYTTVGVTSDALCSPVDGAIPSKEESQCNDLLKAAGEC
jgi:hypothetical protein